MTKERALALSFFSNPDAEESARVFYFHHAPLRTDAIYLD